MYVKEEKNEKCCPPYIYKRLCWNRNFHESAGKDGKKCISKVEQLVSTNNENATAE